MKVLSTSSLKRLNKYNFQCFQQKMVYIMTSTYIASTVQITLKFHFQVLFSFWMCITLHRMTCAYFETFENYQKIIFHPQLSFLFDCTYGLLHSKKVMLLIDYMIWTTRYNIWAVAMWANNRSVWPNLKMTAYRKNHSCQTTLLMLVEDLKMAIDW